MKKEDCIIMDDSFELFCKKYDCGFAIKRDMKAILREAEFTHKTEFDECYDKLSLKPKKVRLYIDDNNNPIYGFIIYTIHNKKADYDREACGSYYPIWDNTLMPHLFQESICW